MVDPAENMPTTKEMISFLIETSRGLVECGCSSNRVEHLMEKLGNSWDFKVETMALPTGVWIKVRKGDEVLLDLARVSSWSVDLDKLARINDLVDSFEEHLISMSEAREKIREEIAAKPPYGPLLTLLAGGFAASVLVYLYRGSNVEVALAFVPGFLVQIMQKYLLTGENRRYLADFLSAAVVASYAFVCVRYFPEIDAGRLIVGGIICLVPGLISVNAFHEIAQKNLVSGVSKLFEAMVISASLAFGVIMAFTVFTLFGWGGL